MKRSGRCSDASCRQRLRRSEVLTRGQVDDRCGNRRRLLSRAVVALGVALTKVTTEIMLDRVHGIADDE